MAKQGKSDVPKGGKRVGGVPPNDRIQWQKSSQQWEAPTATFAPERGELSCRNRGLIIGAAAESTPRSTVRLSLSSGRSSA